MCLHNQPPTVLKLDLANLTPADAQFIGDVVALFTDPARAEQLRALRERRLVLEYGPQGHAVPGAAPVFFANN